MNPERKRISAEIVKLGAGTVILISLFRAKISLTASAVHADTDQPDLVGKRSGMSVFALGISGSRIPLAGVRVRRVS